MHDTTISNYTIYDPPHGIAAMERHISRSPSPNPQAGWSTPGLSSPRRGHHSNTGTPTLSASHEVTWASAQARSAQINNFPRSPNSNSNLFGLGLVGRVSRKVSDSLPLFGRDEEEQFSIKDKWTGPPRGGAGRGIKGWLGMVSTRLRRMKLRNALILLAIFALFIFFHARELSQ